MIDVRGLTIRYPRSDRAAVDDLSLTVRDGEVFGFIGPNGAGKTSTLKVLAGLMRPAAGSVHVAGVDVTAHPAGVRSRVGYLPDFFGVYDDLTCREYLEFFAAAQGLASRRRETMVDEVLALVDLGAKADTAAGALSRGMQQRLGLARVLVHEPSVLLLDEPASGLDPRARIEIREVLRELGRMGKAVIVSSHVLSDLASICTSVGIIEGGRLAFSGTVDEALVAAGSADCSVRVACAEGAAAARAALATDDALSGASIAEANGHVRVTVTLPAAGRDGEAARHEAAARIGACVSRAGLRLTHLEIERVDLERAFLALTEGRLA